MPYKDPIKRAECSRTSCRTWYKNHKAERRKQIIIRKLYIYNWYISYKKTLKCSLCPESDWRCLDFHHRDKNDKVDDISRMVSDAFSIENIMKEVVKCDVLCSNCHRKITIKDR